MSLKEWISILRTFFVISIDTPMKMMCGFWNPAGLHCALLAGNLQNCCLKMIFPDQKSVHYAYFSFFPFCWQQKCIKHILCSALFYFIRTSFTVHAGVPEEIIKRATAVLDTVSNNKHVERLSNENISAQDRQYKVSYQFSRTKLLLWILFTLSETC